MGDPQNGHTAHVQFNGRLVFLGFGVIGQGVLPLVMRHISGLSSDKVTLVSAAEHVGAEIAAEFGVKLLHKTLTPENYVAVLTPMLGPGDFLLNLSVDVSSLDLIELSAKLGCLYLDTCIEPWEGGYTDSSVSISHRSNYGFRENALALRDKLQKEGEGTLPTALITHGANPGMVSHFVKQALLNIAGDLGIAVTEDPKSREEWAALAEKVGVKVVHIAERDTQIPSIPKADGEFCNTWSVDGFIGEGCQPSELGWGTHEKSLPTDGRRHDFGCDSAIYLTRPGASTRVRTWTPESGTFHGFLVTHGESISLSDYFTVRKDDKVVYRPTVHYSYHPSDSAIVSLHELAGRNWNPQEKKRILMHEIIPGGIDELGVLLAGHAKNAYWYGSQLSISEARELAPHNSATSLQVTAAVLAGIVWVMENPTRGLVEPEEMDFRRVLEICRPYLGPVVGKYTDWTPLHDRKQMFPEDIDESDPWQFKNVRVA